MRINLIQEYYINPERQSELDYCLAQNIKNPAIDKIVLLCENCDAQLFDNGKTICIPTISRATYKELFNYADPESINIIANMDIFFDETIALARGIKENECYALTRYEYGKHFDPYLFGGNGRKDSQDVWIFKCAIKPVKAAFVLGVGGCDNRIAYLLNEVGYTVKNPCHSIKSYHYHIGNTRTWQSKPPVEPPYLYVEPCAL
jgi:hypothetical protein